MDPDKIFSRRFKYEVMNPPAGLDEEEVVALRQRLALLFGRLKPLSRYEVERELRRREKGGLI